MGPFPALMAVQKALSAIPVWSPSELQTGYVWFEAPLEIGGVTEPGFTLHVGAIVTAPQEHVTFELAVRNVRGRRRMPLARIDWRSLTGGHSNPRGYGPEAYR